jgi:hypothetical protein
MLKTPPKPHAPLKAKKAKPSRGTGAKGGSAGHMPQRADAVSGKAGRRQRHRQRSSRSPPRSALHNHRLPLTMSRVGDRTAIQQARHSGAFPRVRLRSPTGVGMSDARRLSSKTFKTWIPARDALDSVAGSVGAERAPRLILEYLKGGMLRAAAGKSSSHISEQDPVQYTNVEIPARYWEQLTAEDFWNTGIVNFVFAMRSIRPSRQTIRCFDVRFEPRGVREIASTAIRANKDQNFSRQQPPKPSNRRGPPPKEWWDDLWVEMFRRIHFGAFTPKKQAELENAMADWLEENGHSASERTLRNAAKKLFNALREEGQ